MAMLFSLWDETPPQSPVSGWGGVGCGEERAQTQASDWPRLFFDHSDPAPGNPKAKCDLKSDQVNPMHGKPSQS